MYRVEHLQDGYSRDFAPIVSLNGPLLVIGGVSGVGKTSACEAVLARQPDLTILRNFTTRPPRADSDARFNLCSDEVEFARHVAAANVVCFCVWSANRHAYALLRSELERQPPGAPAIFTSTYFGWVLKAQQPRLVVNAWLVCEDPATLHSRLALRRSETPTEREQRALAALHEQRFIIAHGRELLAAQKIDLVLDTATLSPAQVADALLARLVQAEDGR